jgi:hypothetical protein
MCPSLNSNEAKSSGYFLRLALLLRLMTCPVTAFGGQERREFIYNYELI